MSVLLYEPLVATPARNRSECATQVHGHERAVAVPGDADAVRIGHAQAHGLIDRGLGVGDELLEIRVVGFLRDRR